MGRWQTVKIGDVCVVERGGSPRPIDKYITTSDDGVNWIKIGDTTDSMYITATEQKIIPEGMKKSRYVQPGDFLLSNSMSFGRPYIMKIDGCIHDGWLVLRDKDELFDKRFLYYYLSAPSTYQKFKALAVGGVVNNLNSEMVRNVSVPLPPLVEQKKIATLFDKICDLISLRKQQISKLDELVKARFVEMFGDQHFNTKHLKEGFLADVAEISLGLTHTPTYVTSGIPFLSVRDISSGLIDFSQCHYIAKEEFLSLPSGAKPTSGDVLFCRVGTIGKPVIVPPNIPEFGTFVSVGYLRSKKDVCNIYLKHWMQDPYFMQQVYDNVAGASQINLNTGWLKKFKILIPSKELQLQFVSFERQAEKYKLTIQQSLDKLEMLKKSLMQEYFG